MGWGRLHTSNARGLKGLEVEITNLETKITTTNSSIREAANFVISDIKPL
jgi:hypothetical protein